MAQVFFIEFLGAAPQAHRVTAVALREASCAELRDGVLLFLERHLKHMLAKQHAALKAPARSFVGLLEGDLEPAVG